MIRMAHWGDIDKNAVHEAFSKIKQDMARLTKEMYDLKLEQKKLLEENMSLKQQVNSENHNVFIEEVVKETLRNIKPKNQANDKLIKKFNKKRKALIVSRISTLANKKNLSLPEIKEIIVDNESICSKATFYRYIEKLKNQGAIELIKINDMDVLITI